MSKVICDVCGTAYPETAAQCPICGSAKNSPNQTAAGSTGGADAASSASYAYVKGGRFSKKNVRRRSKRGSSATTAQRRSAGGSRTVQENNEPNNTGLIIVVVLLILAIIAVLIYIGTQWPWGGEKPDNTDNTGTTGSTVQTGEPTGSSQLEQIPCTKLELSNSVLELNVGESWTLTVQLEPVDTTDEVIYSTDDPAVATVSEDGEVTVVGEGETVITVTCGAMSATCTVKTPNSGADDPEPGVFEFAFNTPFTDSSTGYGDTTLSAAGDTWRAYKTTLEVDPADITWITDNPEVCTIEKGIVTAVGPGKTLIHAQYNGVTYTCVVRCSFDIADVSNECSISHKDVTISVDESFTLKLKDGSGYTLDVTWTCDGEGVTIDGNKITGAKSGTWKVKTTYNGKTYTCTVRVK